MNAGSRSTGAYDELKRLLLSGKIAPAQRLDPRSLARVLATGVTPVREGLLRLAGERLVELRLNTGFHMPVVTESMLLGLYQWNLDVLRLALRSAAGKSHASHRESPFSADPPSAEALFLGVAEWSGRPELIAQITSANDRLAIPRIAESSVIADVQNELSDMASSAADPESVVLRITPYHKRRYKIVRDIVTQIYRLPNNSHS